MYQNLVYDVYNLCAWALVLTAESHFKYPWYETVDIFCWNSESGFSIMGFGNLTIF